MVSIWGDDMSADVLRSAQFSESLAQKSLILRPFKL